MSSNEIKQKIHKAIDDITDSEQLIKVLQYIISTHSQADKKIDLAKHLDKIIKDHDNLLRRLAQ